MLEIAKSLFRPLTSLSFFIFFTFISLTTVLVKVSAIYAPDCVFKEVSDFLSGEFFEVCRGDLIVKDTNENYWVKRRGILSKQVVPPKLARLLLVDVAVSPSGDYRLDITEDRKKVMRRRFSDDSRLVIAYAEGRSFLSSVPAVDRLGHYAAVIQDNRQILLFEVFDAPHHQGVIYKTGDLIVSLAWDTFPFEDDLLILSKLPEGRSYIVRISPAARHRDSDPRKPGSFPFNVFADCHFSTNWLTECMIKHNKSMLKTVTDEGFGVENIESFWVVW